MVIWSFIVGLAAGLATGALVLMNMLMKHREEINKERYKWTRKTH